MKVAFSGGRNLKVSLSEVLDALNAVGTLGPVDRNKLLFEILVGDCPTGVDAAVREWAKGCVVYRAEWERHGKAAGPKRNREMISNADALVAFWDGQSRGTQSAISEAKRKGIPTLILYKKQGVSLD